MVAAAFFMGWYMFDRYIQITESKSTVQTEELNNPRLNESLQRKVQSTFNQKKIYSEGDIVNYSTEEKDPFYE